MGLYGNLSMLKSYLVQDPDFGLVGYGCAVAETGNDYTLVPEDGLGVRASFVPLGVALETVRARIEKATLTKRFTAVGACSVEAVQACGMCAYLYSGDGGGFLSV